MAVLYSVPFYHFIEHQNAGVFDPMTSITVCPLIEFGSSIDIGGTTDPEALSLAEWLDDWSTYTQLADAEVATVTTSYPIPNAFQWAIPDLVFDVGTEIDPVGGLLFYYDTGTPSTSPLIGIEVWDSFATPVPFEVGIPYTWYAPEYLVRWTMS